ncbi:hypothetical protein LCGC14_0318640 [marine sediment metagenome]|uniref:Uncharacterized protein n=1 Tax=marine sediment metagenome TaxID=412755 RepID=A0A0F9TK33_9ZZZZ
MGRTRAWRRHQKERVIENRLRLVRDLSQDDDWYEQLLEKRSRLSAHSPYDCGKTRCQICHFGKVFYRKGRHNERWKATQEELLHVA